MHLVYIDESGDEEKFIYTALAIPANRWHSCLKMIKEFRHEKKRIDGISVHTEFHAWKFVSGRGKIADHIIPKKRLCDIFRQMLQMTTMLPEVRLFNAVFPAREGKFAYEALLARINQTLQKWNSYAILICDEGQANIYTKLVRRMQLSENYAVNRILEDPFFKSSDQSYFIQLSDFCAYALLRREHPVASKTRYGLDQAFNLLKPISEGIIRPDS